jgi:hypothetical protein
MEVTLTDLQRTYAAKTDEELLQLHGRGTLTEIGYQAIEAELTSREITVPPRPPEGTELATERHQDERLRGLNGWLVLVGVGVVLSPLRMFATFVPAFFPILTDGTWQALTVEGSEAYHPLWAPIILGEIVFNLGLLGASGYLIYLFFSKSYLFPQAYITIVLVSAVFIPLDAWVVTFVLPGEPMFDPATAREFGRVFVGAIIWIPYMLASRRVRATFVEGRRVSASAA